MKLKTVTFTGLDDQVDLSTVVDLSQQYPFVEWGILLSVKRQGNHTRYPSVKRLQEIGALNIHKSAHICGELARDAMKGQVWPLLHAVQNVEGARRVQINIGQPQSDLLPLVPGLWEKSRSLEIEIILQCADFLQTSSIATCDGVSFLHDASGGRGISDCFQAPINSDFVGYAGGISPGNVLNKLRDVLRFGSDHIDPGFSWTPNVSHDNDFWLDMESGVRNDDDELDLEKVAKVCSLVEPYVNKEKPC